jgi:cytochrome P450
VPARLAARRPERADAARRPHPGPPGPRNDLVRQGEQHIAEVAGWVYTRCERHRLTPDGFGAQVWAAADRSDITLLSAGVDITVHGQGAVLYAFATHPEQWRRLRDNPGLARVAFDEGARVESPLQMFFRTATTDVEVAGTVIPDGSKVLLSLGAANRDPRRWDNPDAFDLSRDPSGHVGFGMGLHQCAGQHIARLEAEALLTALARRVDRIELTGPVRRHPNNTLRVLKSLPVRLHLR